MSILDVELWVKVACCKINWVHELKENSIIRGLFEKFVDNCHIFFIWRYMLSKFGRNILTINPNDMYEFWRNITIDLKFVQILKMQKSDRGAGQNLVSYRQYNK